MNKFLSIILATFVLFIGFGTLNLQAQEEQKDISGCTFENSLGAYESIVLLPSQRYTGSEIKPNVVIKDGDYTLIEGTDYIISPHNASDNINVNTNPWCFFSSDGNDTFPGIVVYGRGKYKGLKQMVFAILSEDQKETPEHLIYSSRQVLDGFYGISIEGYVGTREEVTIPDNLDGKPVEIINKNAFSENPMLKIVNISNNTVQLMQNAFSGCRNLQQIKLSSKLRGIATCAFTDCVSLKEISLPETMELIGNDVFGGCTSMETIYSKSEIIYSVDGVLYCRDSKRNDLYFYPPAKRAETLRIQNGTKRIYSDAFLDAKNISNIIVPSSIETIFGGIYGSFYGLTSPVNIVYKHTIPCTLTDGILGPDTFYDLPAGSTITVRNEDMKTAAESAISEQCQGNVTVQIANTPAGSLTLSENTLTLPKRAQTQLHWTQTPLDTTENVTWKSSDESVAKADPVRGMVTAQGYGKCKITGTDESEHSATADVLVYDDCTRHLFLFDYNRPGNTFKPDDEHTRCVLPELVNGKEEATLTLDKYSYITAVAFADGYAGAMPIRFENSASDVIRISDKSESTYLTAIPNHLGQFTSEIYDEEKNKYTTLFLEPLKPGTSTLTAIFDDNGKEIRESITIYVKNKPTDTTKPEPEPDPQKQVQELEYKKSFQKPYGSKPFSLGVKRIKGNGGLNYSSSNEKVATVSAKGKVTIKATGRTIISVTAKETEKYRKKTVKITVDIIPKKQTVALKPAKGRKLTIKWKKDSKATGYQIQYSTNRKFKKNTGKINVKGNKKVSIKSPKLRKGKIYYVRTRSYKSIKEKGKEKKLYGSWSSTKKSKKIK